MAHIYNHLRGFDKNLYKFLFCSTPATFPTHVSQGSVILSVFISTTDPHVSPEPHVDSLPLQILYFRSCRPYPQGLLLWVSHVFVTRHRLDITRLHVKLLESACCPFELTSHRVRIYTAWSYTPVLYYDRQSRAVSA